jgi:hypothetical protein
MTATTTTRLGMYKTSSDGADFVNVVTDLLNNLDAIDLNIGYRDCTSTTRPSTVWKGLPIRESDTGRLYVSNGTAPASGSWKQIPAEGATFLAAFTFAGAVSLNSTLAVTGATTLGSTLAVTGAATFNSTITASGNIAAPNFTPGVWSTYTPTWGSTGTAPALGTGGSIAGRYTVFGKLAIVTIKLITGSTATFGTGNWTFSLPSGLAFQNAHTTPALAIGTVYGNRSAGAAPSSVFAYGSTSTTVTVGASVDALWNATTPVTWVNSATNYVTMTLTYEIA